MQEQNKDIQNSLIGLPKPNPAFLDTLAQLGTNPEISQIFKVSRGITGIQKLRKRAVSKYFSEKIIFPLIDLNGKLTKPYWTTYHCVRLQLQDGHKITAKYCGQRWCIVCNHIRTGKLLNGYRKQMEGLDDLQLVTLTAPSVKDANLMERIDEMVYIIQTIQNLFRHRRKHRIIGIRKIEITYNEKTGLYHPHFHFIISGKQVADALVQEWLNRNPNSKRPAQDIRPCYNLIEAFKYGCKLFKSHQEGGKRVVTIYPPKALNTMFLSLRNRRIIQPMGGLKYVNEEITELTSTVSIDEDRTEIWNWEQEWGDWTNAEGELLSGSEPPDVVFVNG